MVKASEWKRIYMVHCVLDRRYSQMPEMRFRGLS